VNHKMLLLTKTKVEGAEKENKISWNFKKAKWKEYQKETETKLLTRKRQQMNIQNMKNYVILLWRRQINTFQ
jgi:hypothetical protein